MQRIVVFAFGVVSYVVFFLTFLYAIVFVGNLWDSKTIDAGTEGDFGTSLLINVALLGLFGLQHTVMARPEFKRQWTKIVPESIERSIYVLLSSGLLILLFWQWRPMLGIIWNVENTIGIYLLTAVFFLGWFIVLLGTFLISHFELFGLSQVYHYFKGEEAKPIEFRTPLLYKIVRHPIMLGFIIAFWATPKMTVGHLVFAAVTTVYIIVALQFEERDLVAAHGDEYKDYKKSVSMIVPLPPKK